MTSIRKPQVSPLSFACFQLTLVADALVTLIKAKGELVEDTSVHLIHPCQNSSPILVYPCLLNVFHYIRVILYSSWLLVGSWLFCLQNLSATHAVLKWVWPSMDRYRMFFVQTSTLPPNMHLKLTKHGRFCKQNNQLPTKSHDESKDNSIV